MSHSYTKLWLHVVFSTKYRAVLIHPSVEAKVYGYLHQQLTEQGCIVKIINGMPDHFHLLFLQNPKLSIADMIKQIKGSTSHWINQQEIIKEKFAWQMGYGAFSVSESQVDKVFHYIVTQKEHHSSKGFSQEYDEFLLAHGLKKEEEE
jgi:putative transposase